MPFYVVTGAAGYVGRNLVSRLLATQDCQVVGVDRRETNITDPNYRHVILDLAQADLTSIPSPDENSAEKIVVFHLAARAYVAESFEKPVEYITDNVLATQRLINHYSGDFKVEFIFASTCSLFRSVDRPIGEKAIKEPINPYAATKLASELALDFAARVNPNFSARVVRFFNVCGASGPHMVENHTPETHLIPNLIDAALSGKSVNVFGSDFSTKDGFAVRDYIDVRDLVHFMTSLPRAQDLSRFEDFNLGSGSGTSVIEALQSVEEILGVTCDYNVGPRRPGDPDTLVADYSKAKLMLGWAPTFTLKDSIRSMVIPC